MICQGPIPARAGEPGALPWQTRLPRAYPRACGGTTGGFGNMSAAQGLSPRVRGNRMLSPAAVSVPRAYPRACGGTPTETSS